MPIDISKELIYYADSKYISFIKFDLTYQRVWAWENFLDFWENGETPSKIHKMIIKLHQQIQHIKEPYCIRFKLLSV